MRADNVLTFAEDLGRASDLTRDFGNLHREMNGQPLVWA